jgi:hypothetical protein
LEKPLPVVFVVPVDGDAAPGIHADWRWKREPVRLLVFPCEMGLVESEPRELREAFSRNVAERAAQRDLAVDVRDGR